MKPFRDRLEDFARAPWLRKTWLYRLLYTFAVHIDAMADATVLGVKARYPLLAPPDALPVLGRERGIRRGFEEGATSYALRLSRWLIDRKRRGSPYALMSQLAGYLTPHAVAFRVVNNQGAWFSRAADGTESYYRSFWNWDGITTAGYSRWWLIIYPPSSLWSYEGLWGSAGEWGDGGQWGCTITQDQIDTILAIVAEWNPPHAKCAGVILAFDPTSFNPATTTGMPFGRWARWGSGTTSYGAVRLATARFGEIIPA